MTHTIYLASASPRRKQLLSLLPVEFEQFSVDLDETPQAGETAQQLVCRLASEKAQAGVKCATNNWPVLGSDTIVVLDGKILGKPTDKQDALTMLKSLSGRTHQVMTAIAFANTTKLVCELVVTEVTFKILSADEIEQYWQSGEPSDKAGAYGIQGLAGRFVTNINGSYFAVMGLPLYETEALLNRFLKD